MTRFEKFLHWLSSKLPVYFHLDGYMNRWWLLPAFLLKRDRHGHLKPRRFVPRIRLHQTLRSDIERHLHCHPQSNCSIILTTGYTEVVPALQSQPPYEDLFQWNQTWRSRSPGSIIFRSAAHRHRLLIAYGKCCWSIFIMFGKRREWGFHTAKGFVNHRYYSDFLANKRAP